MGTLSCAVGALVLLAPAAASAADNFISAVHLKSEKICADARNNSLQKVLEDGNIVLSARGFGAIEYNCAFVQVANHPRQEKTWLASAICEEPGLMSPDFFSAIERQPGQLEVTSMKDKDGGDEDDLSGTDFRCDGVTPP